MSVFLFSETGAQVASSSINEANVTDVVQDFQRIIGPDWEKKIEEFSYVLIKPEAVVARAVEALFSSLKSNGFIPLVCKPIPFNRYVWRNLWKSLLANMSMGRICLIDRLYAEKRCYFILVQNSTPSTDLSSACAQLKAVKGGAYANNRKTGDLRTSMGAKTGLLTFIHAPDTTQDMLRELGVLLPQDARLEIGRIMNHPSEPLLFETIKDEIYKDVPHNPLNITDATQRIDTILVQNESPDAVFIRSLCEAVRANRRGEISAQAVFEAFDRLNLSIDPWDIMTFSAYISEVD